MGGDWNCPLAYIIYRFCFELFPHGSSPNPSCLLFKPPPDSFPSLAVMATSPFSCYPGHQLSLHFLLDSDIHLSHSRFRQNLIEIFWDYNIITTSLPYRSFLQTLLHLPYFKFLTSIFTSFIMVLLYIYYMCAWPLCLCNVAGVCVSCVSPLPLDSQSADVLFSLKCLESCSPFSLVAYSSFV